MSDDRKQTIWTGRTGRFGRVKSGSLTAGESVNDSDMNPYTNGDRHFLISENGFQFKEMP